jgi:peptidoglycan/xylan/chitin deacetylase (PgdA/CDA1 family)
MPRRRDPVPRARAAGHWLGGILLLGVLGGAVVAAAVLLWENLDVRQLAPTLAVSPGPIPEPDPSVPAAFHPASFPVVLFNSPRNRAFFPDDSYYLGALSRWRRLLESLGGEVREASAAEDLENLTSGDLLVVPAAPCLSQAEVDAMARHLDGGGGVLSNWAVGARDESCEWRGWETVADLTGAGDVRELASREALFFTVPGGLPLSPGLDPGTRIELRPEPSLALNLPGPRVFWSDWALNPAPDESGGGADVAAVAGRTQEGGRMAWFGFRLSQAATPRDSSRMERLVQNGISWAAGLAVATPATWPNGSRAALVVIQDVEAEFQNAIAMADVLREESLPGTFFPVSRLVMDDQELADALTSAGEVGSQTSDHTPVAGLTYEDQLVRLRRSWTEIRGWTGQGPMGLRPPEEAFDANTLRAWAEAGGQYVLAVNQARSGSPEIHSIGRGGHVVLLPRLLKDDYNVFVQEGAMRGDRLSEAYLEGTDKLRALGGLAVVASHTQIIGEGRRLDAIRDVAEKVRTQGDWWIATASDVAAWWEARAAATVTIGPAEAPGLDILVEAPSDEALSGLWIDVVIPDPGPDGLIPLVNGYPVSFATTDWGIRVSVGELAAGEVRLISLRAPAPDSLGTGSP